MRLCHIAALFLVSAVNSAHAIEPYELGRGDVVEIIVSAGGQLTRRTQIGVSGAVTVPLVGEISIAGLTPSAAADKIAKMFRDRGDHEQVNAIVEVVAYRPVYVAGAVPKPGPYEYRPGMTIRQLLAMAGGESAGSDRPDVIPEVLQSDYEDALNALVHAHIRQARLRALAFGASEFTAPDIDASGLSPRRVQDILDVEQSAWRAGEDETARRRAFAETTAKVLQEQISDLNEQLRQEEANIELAEGEFQRMKAAFNKGVIAGPRMSETQQALALVKMRRAETAARIAEARRNLLEVEWRLDQSLQGRKLEAFAALQKELQEGQRAESAVAAARARLQQARIQPRTPKGTIGQVRISIHSETNTEKIGALESEAMPGDTVIVSKTFTDAGPLASAQK